ncbi:hypothetical protein RSA37_03155 [Mammaliicoccus sciuri]|uniref:class I SAM-dependent methyltransferase n=1 Tax=Mammaliicoccus sciuri TaxID=1296 RepID=UPI0007340050|nr:hypothetical protein [Mammaliicoccus sciuri]KTT85202.1 hypothetical protein NS1R_07725 [Mammaliicoccus sciuri]KTT88015.1 hypothetical protein NS36R_11685 [Mammaliicoccus sciuri]KTT90250.1 hypothetical protein NS112_03725 [Mammaliicoccus sciuri]KTT94640.1 hypothetical protein NS44R_04435 [Mammaliicoccus sciuri]KTW13313.1 hypothetical protein RSA37_03155 [Mammaliicoccus sciuri]
MNQWDEKFDTKKYIYGELANEFILEKFSNNTDNNEKIVLLAEGEGRNAIYLAKLGYEITTFDISKVGINKQIDLAKKENVSIDTNYGDITVSDLVEVEKYNYSINIFGHVPNEGKQKMFNNLITALIPTGHAIFELYSVEQLEYGTGGPKDKSMLYTVDEIKTIFKNYNVKIHRLEKVLIDRYEGHMHNGRASVIQGDIEKIM